MIFKRRAFTFHQERKTSLSYELIFQWNQNIVLQEKKIDGIRIPREESQVSSKNEPIVRFAVTLTPEKPLRLFFFSKTLVFTDGKILRFAVFALANAKRNLTFRGSSNTEKVNRRFAFLEGLCFASPRTKTKKIIVQQNPTIRSGTKTGKIKSTFRLLKGIVLRIIRQKPERENCP